MNKLLQVLRWTRSERVAQGEADDEVDRSGRRHADASAKRTPSPAPEGGYSSFAAEGGDCTHPEGRGIYLQLQGDGRRGPQDYPDLPEVWRQQRGGHLEGGTCVAPRMPRLCAAQRDSTRAGRDGNQHPYHATRRYDRSPGAP